MLTNGRLIKCPDYHIASPTATSITSVGLSVMHP